MSNQKTLFALLMALLMIVNIKADDSVSTLLEWNFYGADITGKEEQSAAIIVDHSLEQAVLTRGEGAPGNNGYTHGFVATIQPSASKEEAIADDVYLEFKVQPKVGASINLSEMIVQLRSQTECEYQWMYAVNDSEFKTLTDVVALENTSSGVFQTPLALAEVDDLQNLTQNEIITIRIYVWGGDKVQGFGFGKSTAAGTAGYGPSITVKGEVVNRSDIYPLAGWNFEPYTSVTEGSLNASTLEEGLQYAILSRGIGFTAASLNFSYVSSAIAVAQTKAEAISNDEYFEIHFKSSNEEKVTLSSLNYKYRRNNAGPHGYKWMYSINGSEFADVGSEVEDHAEFSQNGHDYVIDLTSVAEFDQLAEGTTVKLRMYAWGAGASNQVFGFGRQFVGSVAVPGVNTVYLTGKYGDLGSGVDHIQKKSAYHVFTRDGNLVITGSEETAGKTSLMLTDLTGRVAHSQVLDGLSGNKTVTIPLHLSGMNYVLAIRENNQLVHRQIVNL